MSISLSYDCLLTIKDNETTEKKIDFITKLKDLFVKYNQNSGEGFDYDNENALCFSLYARHYFMSDIINLLEEYKETIDKATLFCNADADDFPANEPFPFLTYVEVINNTVEEQTLYRKIDGMWSHYTYKQIQDAKENNICL